MPYPIVLAHGIARFDVISPLTKYWNFIPDLLERIGIPVFEAADVEWVGSVRKRSKQLAERVEEVLDISGSDKVNLIGHSMGGLDCRRAIVLEGLADKVASLDMTREKWTVV